MAQRPLSKGVKVSSLVFLSALLSGCSLFGSKNIEDIVTFSSADMGVSASKRLIESPREEVPKGGGRRHVGKPYKINGQWFYPKDDPNYSKKGTASWYGNKFHGRLTANGEIFDMNSISAAHTTMPLPSYARVTNLENGRSLTVRVNDRGPFVHDRLIDLSQRSAKLLGFHGNGVAKVRVDYIGPADLAGSDDKKLAATLRLNGAPYHPEGEDRQLASNKPVSSGNALETARALQAATPKKRRINSYESSSDSFSLGKAYSAYSQKKSQDNNLITNAIEDTPSETSTLIKAEDFSPLEANLLTLAGVLPSSDHKQGSAVKVTSLPKTAQPPRTVSLSTNSAINASPRPQIVKPEQSPRKRVEAPIPAPTKAKSVDKLSPAPSTEPVIASLRETPSAMTDQPLIETADKLPSSDALPKVSLTKTYRIQVARFRAQDNARQTMATLPRSLNPEIVSGTDGEGIYYSIYAGSFTSKEQADVPLKTIKNLGFLSARLDAN